MSGRGGRSGILLGALWLVAAACAPGKPPAPDAGPLRCAPGTPAEIEANCRCFASIDCAAGNTAAWLCTPANACVRTCESSPDCGGSAVCDDLLCRPPACGDDSECANGNQCIGGSCQAPIPAASVAACEVVPPNAVINAGGVKTFHVLAQDASSRGTAYSGPVAWTTTTLAATTADSGMAATFRAASDAPAGVGQVQAAIGSVPCTPATLREYAAATSAVRVVVVSDGPTLALPDGSPIAGATVILDDGAPAETDSSGQADFASASASPHVVSVFASGYSYVTVVGTSATDILIPLKAAPNRGVFSDIARPLDFAQVGNPNGGWHVGFSGASFGGNLMDLSPTRMLGPAMSPMLVNLGTATSYGPFPVPEGVAQGIGASMFVTGPAQVPGAYAIEADPGYRTFWRLGANEVLGTLVTEAGPALLGGDIQEVPPTTTLLVYDQLRLLGAGGSGLTTDVPVTPGETAALGSQADLLPAEINTLLRLRTNVTTARLPPGMDSMFVAGGAFASPQGFVPLGLSMGIDAVGADGTSNPDGLIDPSAMGQPEGQIPLRLAPRNKGLEAAPWAFISIAIPSLNIYPTEDVVTLSGSVTFAPSTLRYDDAAPTNVDLSRPFLAPPSGAMLDETSRTFTLPAVTGATFHRLDIGPDTNRWSIYFPASITSFSIPTPPSGVPDRFPGMIPGSASAAVLHSAQLGYPPPGTSAPETFDGIWQFDGVDADDLTLETDAFSTRWIPRNGP
jgi:hypothetical protein